MSDAPTKKNVADDVAFATTSNSAGLLLFYPLGAPPAMRYFSLDGSGAVAGRSLDCDIPLVGDDEASRRHARFSRSAQGWKVTDLDSTNGVFVQHRRVDSAPLGDGDVLRIGNALLRYDAPGQGLARTDCQLPVSTGEIVGGPALQPLLQRLRRFAQSDLPALLTGETGTGKELAARMLHREGPRRRGPLITVNCAALPSEVFESQLFGHARGAFTGALRAARGLIREADGGTLFLDEIGELPITLQPKLLRALQERRVLPLGQSKTIGVDFRLVCATNVDLAERVASGRFRDDLLARINTLSVELPPLRARVEDIPLLAEHFARIHGGEGCSLSADALALLCKGAFPRNVRQLESVVQRAIVIADEPSRLGAELFDAVALGAAIGATAPSAAASSLHEALIASGGNVKLAAKSLGISRSQLYRRARTLGVDLDRFRGK